LLTDEPFTQKDIIHIQDPLNLQVSHSIINKLNVNHSIIIRSSFNHPHPRSAEPAFSRSCCMQQQLRAEQGMVALHPKCTLCDFLCVAVCLECLGAGLTDITACCSAPCE